MRMRQSYQSLVLTVVAALGMSGFYSALPGAEVSGAQSGRWTLVGSPYVVTGNVVVPEGMKLTIEPGVVVKFAGYYSIKVNGALSAMGRPLNKIIYLGE